MKNEPKTIIGFKIKGTRKTKDIVWAIGLILGGFLLLTIFALVQIELCQNRFPEKSARECLIRR